MTTVELSIDEENQSFILSGEIESLLKNYRAKYYLLDFLRAIIKDEKYVIIP